MTKQYDVVYSNTKMSDNDLVLTTILWNGYLFPYNFMTETYRDDKEMAHINSVNLQDIMRMHAILRCFIETPPRR